MLHLVLIHIYTDISQYRSTLCFSVHIDYFLNFFELVALSTIRGKNPPLKRPALVGIGLGLEDNIIIHSVNNILILLSMINGVNVKNNRYMYSNVSLRFAICNLLLLLFFTLTLFIIDSRIRILLTLCIIIFFMKYPLTLILSRPTRVVLGGDFPSY